MGEGSSAGTYDQGTMPTKYSVNSNKERELSPGSFFFYLVLKLHPVPFLSHLQTNLISFRDPHGQ